VYITVLSKMCLLMTSTWRREW